MNIDGLKVQVKSSEAIPEVIKFLSEWNFKESGCQVQVQAIGATLTYKSVFWIWMRALAKSFTERSSGEYTDKQMHDILCNKFLGWTGDRKIGNTVIKSTMRTITHPEELNRSEFYHFLREIEIWASDNGVVMPDKPSEYQRDKERETR